MTHNAPTRKRFLPLLIAICVAAICIRWLPYRACFGGEMTYFFGADPYYHLRRVLLAVSDFWTMPTMDYYVGFPKGTPNMLAPLMYLPVAGIVRLFSGGAMPDIGMVETVGAIAPTVWGGACVIPVFFIGRRLGGNLAGLVAAASMAVMPQFLMQTLVGAFDNNGLEPLLAALFFLATAAALPESWRGTLPAGEGAFPFRAGVVAGIAGWFALFTWRGSIMFIMITALYCFLEIIAGFLFNRSPRRALEAVGTACLFVSLCTVPFVAFSLWGAQPVLRFNVISWFHVLAFGGCGGALLAFARMPEACYHSPRSSRVGYAGCALLAASVAFALLMPGRGDSGGFSLRGYLMGQRDLWGVEELTGLFWDNGRFSWTKPLNVLTLAGFAFPFLWLRQAYRQWRNRLDNPAMTLFLVWSLVFCVLTVGRVRFAPLASLGISVTLGVLAGEVAFYLKERGAARFRGAHGTMAACLVALLLFPSWLVIAQLPSLSYKYPVTDDLFDALRWMRDHTPPTSHFSDPWQVPEYGVMAQWDFGHWINYLGRRPAVATPMLGETYGLEPQARFFLTEDVAEAEGVLAENRVRYVVVTNVLQYLSAFAGMLGRSADAYFEEARDPAGRVIDNVKPGWLRLVSTRLLLRDGMPVLDPAAGSPPPHLRLVYESRGRLDIRAIAGDVARVKIFERVAGALLTGKAVAFSPVTVRLPLVTNQGRTFTWQTRVSAGPDGRFTVTLPYSTEAAGGAVHALSPYSVTVNGTEKTVTADSRAVEEGKTITLY